MALFITPILKHKKCQNSAISFENLGEGFKKYFFRLAKFRRFQAFHRLVTTYILAQSLCEARYFAKMCQISAISLKNLDEKYKKVVKLLTKDA